MEHDSREDVPKRLGFGIPPYKTLLQRDVGWLVVWKGRCSRFERGFTLNLYALACSLTSFYYQRRHPSHSHPSTAWCWFLGTVSFTPPERLKYFKYLLSTVKGLSLHFIFKAPPLPYTTNFFALPFDRNVWIGCAIILSLCGLVIWIILRWEVGEHTFQEERESYEENSPNFLDVIMMQVILTTNWTLIFTIIYRF